MNTAPTRFTDPAPRHRRPAPRAAARAGPFLAAAWRAARELARRAPLPLLLPLLLLAVLGPGLVGCMERDLPTAAPSGGPSLLQVPGVNPFTQVGAGFFHTCALRSDGVAECLGNFAGQAPATRSALSGAFTQVSAGYHHTCALRSDGVVECWGPNNGQAPDTRTALSGTFTHLGAGDAHTCALRSDGVAECWVPNADGQAPATRTSIVRIPPTATFSAPATVAAGQSFDLTLSDAQVPGYSDFTEYTATVEVTAAPSGFTFTGFFSPVANLPTVNVAKAGSAIPVKFSLDGNQGLSIFASGSPDSQQTTCDASAPQGPMEGTVTAGSSSLSYDAATDRYTYVWKSDKAWAGTCRRLTLRFADGTTQVASFRFN
jgi:hypothetical protein